MNGVSHMLPFVIGGGILIALAFLLDDYSIDPSNFGKNTPLAAYLKTIGEQAFGMMLPDVYKRQPIYGLIKVVTTAARKIPMTGYRSTGLMPSKDFGSFENSFLKPSTR